MRHSMTSSARARRDLRPEPRQGARFVLPHQPAVPRDIGREDGHEPALNPLFAQGSLPEATHASLKPPDDSIGPGFAAWAEKRSTVQRAGSVRRLAFGSCRVSRGVLRDIQISGSSGISERRLPSRPDHRQARC